MKEMLNNKRKIIVHIHSDYKFVVDSAKYDDNLFENKIIILQDSKPYDGVFRDKAILLNKNKESIDHIIDICNKADLVVLYDLDILKQKIALNIDENIKIAWRFFGYELYSKMIPEVTSKRTRKVIFGFFNKKTICLLERIKNLLRMLKYGINVNKLFFRALKRINYMLVLCEEEYVYLEKKWGYLPEFIQLSYRTIADDVKLPDVSCKIDREKSIIVIGNNRSYYNNHLDIIDLIDKNANKEKYEYLFLFNYGQKKKYYNTVVDATKNKSYYNLIDKFIPINEFTQFYSKITAFVMNGYRQMAAGNIIYALLNGSKIYLNEANVYMKFLLNEGFKVFSIEDFEKDLSNNKLLLDNDIAEYNLSKLKILTQKYNVTEFNERIDSLI